MEISTTVIKTLFKNIERDDINEDTKNLVEDDIIDSVDIMKLIMEIEKIFNKPLNAKFITPDNFKDFQSIQKMLTQALN
ncbi:acyl carrier protein [Campylobacter sp. RKI_CA19_01121]|uniref:acyl carrier protein n=1 Tax=Campylobacter sp. RKI_CA19_01121 TaxID=2911626 RepID=UPI0021E7EC57|nr:acyl carrier protein [Campylobacter sp. RKI_CA19_01121]MCV3336720.1 acyl carrier protein [Campylobacter sp. RKI_CA19_01121]